MIADEIQLVTRISDLDTQRHVTSRTYENFCLEGRFRTLEKNGFSIREILSQGIKNSSFRVSNSISGSTNGRSQFKNGNESFSSERW